jgi:uncharacterized membrane protein YvbJ
LTGLVNDKTGAKMKQCPKCMQTDNDSQRFCQQCGTEIFFVERYAKIDGTEEKRNTGGLRSIFRKLKNK